VVHESSKSSQRLDGSVGRVGRSDGSVEKIQKRRKSNPRARAHCALRDADVRGPGYGRRERPQPVPAQMADAVLSGYDEIVSPENPSKRAEDARRTRLDEFAREYTRRMERDALEAEEEEEELAKMRYASDEGERYAAELERTLGSDDEEAREWRAIATGKLSPALDRAKRRPRGKTARTALFEEEMRRSPFDASTTVGECERKVRERPELAIEGMSHLRGVDERTLERALEDSARGKVEAIESKVMSLEETADDFVRRRLNDFLEDSALSAEEADVFRIRAQRVLERQSKAFEEVIEAADRALAGRVGVMTTEREKLRNELGAEYEAGYDRCNAQGHPFSLKIGHSRGFGLFGVLKKTAGLVVNTAKTTVTSPFMLANGLTYVVRRKEKKTKEEQTVEEFKYFQQTTPTKAPRPEKSGPLSPDARSEMSSMNTARRWPLGATAQRVAGATKRYSVAGSVRSAITRHTIYSEQEYVSEDEDDIEDDGRKVQRRLLRLLVRTLQLGCVTAVIALSTGPEHRVEKTKEIFSKAAQNVEKHVRKGWTALVVRWAAVSTKLTATPSPNRARSSAREVRPSMVVQAPVYVPDDDDMDGETNEVDIVPAPQPISNSAAAMRAYGRG